ncbi:hypothetical protein BS47DRAFT_439273 [Hydnum rufescens UP504]|uniref:L-serine dehydratase n=1 Tax=Hydnum rufescens UP504 TaxID=1448309 RepID=A0A9P6B4U9_9AGAM|nr:hypothetical protein BS47DRAFT_439273 [Hydnum rufescens UP504]
MTPQALMMGFQGCDPETIDTSTINARYENLLSTKILEINGRHRIKYDMDRDMVWRWDQVLPTHPNGMRFSAFDQNGDLLATNEYYSVGGGFVVNEKTKIDENLFYKGVDKSRVAPARLSQAHGMDSTLTGLLQPSPVQNSDSSPESSSDPYKSSQPRYLFHSGDSLLALTRKHNLTIAQLVYENELHYLSPDEIHDKLFKIWGVMDECIRTGVSTTEETLPGRLQLKRRAPALYRCRPAAILIAIVLFLTISNRRLMKGFYPAIYAPSSNPAIAAPTPDISDSHLDVINPTAALNPMSARAAPQVTNGSDRPPASVTPTIPSMRRKLVRGKLDHPIPPMPTRKASFPGIDFLSCYAIAVNEVNASGGRIVTSPTNGASGVIPAVLKYILEFLSEDPQRDISTFLLTASAIGMLFKRGSTISAAEGCQAEVGVACSMAAAGFSACMGASPEIILQSAEIGIEHNLGLTCDPIDGLVQVPCIERNSLGAIKAVTAAQLAMASGGVHSVTLDEAIAAMRMTATDMSEKYKETSLGGLATTVRIPLTSPAC